MVGSKSGSLTVNLEPVSACSTDEARKDLRISFHMSDAIIHPISPVSLLETLRRASPKTTSEVWKCFGANPHHSMTGFQITSNSSLTSDPLLGTRSFPKLVFAGFRILAIKLAPPWNRFPILTSHFPSSRPFPLAGCLEQFPSD